MVEGPLEVAGKKIDDLDDQQVKTLTLLGALSLCVNPVMWCAAPLFASFRRRLVL
jgi:hypothetical protein